MVTGELWLGAAAHAAPTCHLDLAAGTAGGERGMAVIASGSTVETHRGRPGGRRRSPQGWPRGARSIAVVDGGAHGGCASSSGQRAAGSELGGESHVRARRGQRGRGRGRGRVCECGGTRQPLPQRRRVQRGEAVDDALGEVGGRSGGPVWCQSIRPITCDDDAGRTWSHRDAGRAACDGSLFVFRPSRGPPSRRCSA